MSDEIIKPPSTSDNSLSLALKYTGNKTRVKFDGSCLKQDKLTFWWLLSIRKWFVGCN